MNIAYFEPLTRAWNRMKKALFQPFNLHKWFVVGFTAFLAGLVGHHGGGSGNAGSRGDGLSFREFLNLPQRGWEWLMDHPGWFIGIIFIVFFIFVIVTVLTWLSSRGHFMFLDNVVHDKAEIANPWKQYSREGNSLFIWRFCFGLISFALFVILIFAFFAGASRLYAGSYYDRVPVFFIVQMAFLLLLLIVVIGYITSFLTSFVVPIMYKHNLTATQAWRRFLSLFGRHVFHFLLYGLFVFVLSFLVWIAVIIAGVLTCCIGIILLIIPYIGTVVTLPIWYTFRAFSLEYLAQFGDDFDVFPQIEPETAEAKV